MPRCQRGRREFESRLLLNMTENERLKELLKEVVDTFEPMYHQSDVLKRIRTELGIDPPWFVKQHENETKQEVA
jgi:hypothetical protein